MRISKKIVLDYLKSVYPAWKTFEQIVDEVPVMFNFDIYELEDRLKKLYNEGKIDKWWETIDVTPYSDSQRYRLHIKE